MPPIALFIVIYFLFVAFVSNKPEGDITNSFLSYGNIQLSFILDHLWLFIFGTIVVGLLPSLTKDAKRKHFGIFMKRLSVVSVFGFFLSFFLVFMIALAQTNVVSLMMNVSPGLLGVETDSRDIYDKLTRVDAPPKVIAGSEKTKTLSSAIAIAQSGGDSFYGGVIVPGVPKFLTFPVKKLDTGILMLGDTLIVTQINSSDFQNISSVVGYLMIRSYFPGRQIESYPKMAMMNKQEYQAFRDDEFSEKMEVFDGVVSQINKNTDLLEDTVGQEKDQIAQILNTLEETQAQREKEYVNCVNEGYYESGVYYRTNTKEYCREQLSQWDDRVKEIESEREALETSLEQNQNRLKQYEDYLIFYESQKLLAQEESGFISYEFASFSPPDEIKMAYANQENSQAVADYLELLIHEYLHYTNYDNNVAGINSSFFTEGLTEYFARRIVKRTLGVDTNLGYPVNVKIIEQMAKRIPESDFADVYFDSDQRGLEKLLDRVYGDNFYRDNQIILETIHYSSDTDQILKLANEVMSRIGGEMLVEEDVATTSTTFGE